MPSIESLEPRLALTTLTQLTDSLVPENGLSDRDQEDVDVAMSSGNLIAIVWEDEYPSEEDVKLRFYDRLGNPASSEIVVAGSGFDEENPRVAVTPGGIAAVAFERSEPDVDEENVYVTTWSVDGSLQNFVQLYQDEDVRQFRPDVAIQRTPLGQERIVATWEEDFHDSGDRDVFMQIFEMDLTPVTNPIEVAYTFDFESEPAVAVDPINGNIIVAWRNFTENEIEFSVYLPNGENIANTRSALPQLILDDDVFDEPDVAAIGDDGYVIVYNTGSGASFNIVGAVGNDISTDRIDVPFLDADDILNPHVAGDVNGDFVISFTADVRGDDDVYVALFTSEGDYAWGNVVYDDFLADQNLHRVAFHNGLVAVGYTEDDGFGGTRDVRLSTILQDSTRAGVARDNGQGGLTFYLDSNGNRTFDSSDAQFNFGLANDIIISGYFDGGRFTNLGVARDNGQGGLVFSLDTNGNFQFDGSDDVFNFGLVGDTIITGDFNGDGITELGVARDNGQGGLIFSLDTNGNRRFDPGVDAVFNFGLVGDIIVTGDVNGDGVAELGVARNNGQGGLIFSLDSNGSLQFEPGSDDVFNYGLFGDVITTGNFNADGIEDLQVVRATGGGSLVWFPDTNGSASFDASDAQSFYEFGLAGDRIVPGKWNPNQSTGGLAPSAIDSAFSDLDDDEEEDADLFESLVPELGAEA